MLMSLIILERSEGVATLTLNNPAERNTMTAELVSDIKQAMDEIEADESIGAIIVTGAAPAFCAGANLGNLAEADGASLTKIYEGFLRIARTPLPTIAAVNGAAVGAGMNLALCCDVRIAAVRAKFDTRFLQIGLHPVAVTHGCSATSLDRKPRWPQLCLVKFSMVTRRNELAWSINACQTMN